ncbi:MAG: PRC-barrel domain-containing protein [Desulfobacterales bacterium]
MLRSISELLNYQLLAKDGEIGRCKDFLFDDRQWGIRYMVADTSRWLPGRKVLISPLSLGAPQWTQSLLPVQLTKEQIKESPALDEDAPVSRQYEMRWFDFYAYPYYWPHTTLWGINPPPPVPLTQEAPEEEQIEVANESQLRSVREVKGYAIDASDGEIGHVEDFILEDTLWSLRYMVVDTRNWLPGRKVLIAPQWIDHIDWADSAVHVKLDRARIESSPEYDPKEPVNLEYEARLYNYYGRPVP